LGVRLVNRTARTVSLTDAGHRYADFAARIIDEIDREENLLRGQRRKAEGPLSVISPKWIGNGDVADAIVSFSVRYPKIHIRFEVGGMSERSHDFLDQGFDVAFHTRQVRDSSLLLKKITELQFVLCAAPLYAMREGRLTKVVPGCDVPDRPLYALHSPGSEPPVRVQLFIDHVTDWFRRRAVDRPFANPSRPDRARQETTVP
jgi:DNA-binding transcriptional LysR family regulator